MCQLLAVHVVINPQFLTFIMAALRSRCGHYIFVLFLSSFFLVLFLA